MGLTEFSSREDRIRVRFFLQSILVAEPSQPKKGKRATGGPSGGWLGRSPEPTGPASQPAPQQPAYSGTRRRRSRTATACLASRSWPQAQQYHNPHLCHSHLFTSLLFISCLKVFPKEERDGKSTNKIRHKESNNHNNSKNNYLTALQHKHTNTSILNN